MLTSADRVQPQMINLAQEAMMLTLAVAALVVQLKTQSAQQQRHHSLA